MKTNKKILLTVAFLTLVTPFVVFAEDNLINVLVQDNGGWVGFHGLTIFSNDDFKPGDEEISTVSVKNTSGENQCIWMDAYPIDNEGNRIEPEDLPTNSLSYDLLVEIEDLWGDESSTLFNLFDASEIELFCLDPGEEKEFNISVFYPEEKEDQDGATIRFDIKIGAEEKDDSGGNGTPSSNGSRGGGFVPRIAGKVDEAKEEGKEAIEKVKKEVEGAVTVPEVSLAAGGAILSIVLASDFLLALSISLLFLAFVLLLKKTVNLRREN